MPVLKGHRVLLVPFTGKVDFIKAEIAEQPREANWYAIIHGVNLSSQTLTTAKYFYLLRGVLFCRHAGQRWEEGPTRQAPTRLPLRQQGTPFSQKSMTKPDPIKAIPDCWQATVIKGTNHPEHEISEAGSSDPLSYVGADSQQNTVEKNLGPAATSLLPRSTMNILINKLNLCKRR